MGLTDISVQDEVEAEAEAEEEEAASLGVDLEAQERHQQQLKNEQIEQERFVQIARVASRFCGVESVQWMTSSIAIIKT